MNLWITRQDFWNYPVGGRKIKKEWGKIVRFIGYHQQKQSVSYRSPKGEENEDKVEMLVKEYKCPAITWIISWRFNVEDGDCSQQYYIVYMKVAKTINLKYSHHKSKWQLCEVMVKKMLPNPILIIILQYICVWNHCIVYFELT